MASNYDRTAWFYDALAGLVFGKSIRRSQTVFLNLIPADSKVLVAGGGTGWILDEIAQVHPTGLTIYYVEVSAKMIKLSKKRNYGNNEVVFINSLIEDFETNGLDVIITPFLFDNHESSDAENIFQHINQVLKANGLWFNTDFQLKGKWWHKFLLKAMLLFFRFFSAVSNQTITNMQPVFESGRYKKIATKTFYGDFIRTDVWQKPG